MRLAITRHATKNGATVGTLSVDGIPLCFTLEDVVREVPGQPVASWKVYGQTAIPVGTYAVVINRSTHFNCDMPQLLSVPGYEGVRIHPGNSAGDTEGCILVGYVEGDHTIGRSRDAFNALFDKMKSAIYRQDKITLTIA